MGDLSQDLDRIADGIRARLAAKHAAREAALPLSRDVIRYAANAIRAVHRREFHQAEELLRQAEAVLRQAEQGLSAHPDVLHAGWIQDAQKEYAEGHLTLALVAGRPVPGPEELGVGDAAYLNGLGEAAGEVRRYLLDTLRRGDVEACEPLLSVMDEIYAQLVTMDYPDAITGGLRRTTDMVRGVLEKTRGDLTVAARQRQLEERLAAFEERLAGE